MNRVWISLYIYYHEDPTPLLLECLRPISEELRDQQRIQHFFYVRYWEGGPHVRFRVLPAPGADRNDLKTWLITKLEAYLSQHPSLASIDPERYAKATEYFSTFELGQAQAFALQPNNTVREVAYQPEYQSYGGVRAMPVVEQQFSVSSAVGLRLLEQPATNDQRIGRAMLMMLSGLRGFTQHPEELQRWFELYNRNWMPALQPNPDAFRQVFQTRFERQRPRLTQLVDQVLQSFETRDVLLQDWQNSLGVLRQQLWALSAEASLEYNAKPLERKNLPLIALNCLHMHNNRTGISLHEEAYITFLIKESLTSWINDTSTTHLSNRDLQRSSLLESLNTT